MEMAQQPSTSPSSAGWGGFRVRRGRIERISLAIPWTKLYTGAAEPKQLG